MILKTQPKLASKFEPQCSFKQAIFLLKSGVQSITGSNYQLILEDSPLQGVFLD